MQKLTITQTGMMAKSQLSPGGTTIRFATVVRHLKLERGGFDDN